MPVLNGPWTTSKFDRTSKASRHGLDEYWSVSVQLVGSHVVSAKAWNPFAQIPRSNVLDGLEVGEGVVSCVKNHIH